MEINVLIEEPLWEKAGVQRLARAAIPTTLDHVGVDATAAEISILACDDAKIANLNRSYRDKDTATNVLSWPFEDLAPDEAGAAPHPPQPEPDGTLTLGDLAVAYETCAREADELGKPLAEHVTHLVVHGTLHLLGYDHIRDPDATLMQAIEADILGKLGYNDPYND